MADFNIETEIELLKREQFRSHETCKRILTILEGNGTPGLVERVAVNEQFSKQGIKRIWWFITWVPSGVSILGGLIFGVLKFLI